MSAALEQKGFEIINNVLTAETVETLSKAIADFFPPETGNKRSGIRNLLRCPAVAELSRSEAVVSIARARLGKNAFPVRAIFFDKTPETNWLVTWHQDLSIAVAERREAVGFGPWSVKDDITHVQPPCRVSERMLTIRLHLDDCDENNGALKVLPGSHLSGKLTFPEIEKWKECTAPITCAVAKGGVLVMRPLLLHSSSAATLPSHRRVIHIEYAADPLPGGLRWFEN